MALDRLLPISTTPGAIDGDAYLDAVQEEVTGLWDRSIITLTAVSGTNTITATATPALTGALGGNMNFILKPAATNTGAVTLNINGGGAVAVVDAEGGALAAGALRINANYLLHYDSGIAKHVVVGYIPAAAIPVGMKLLKTQVAASVAQIDFVHGVSGVVMDDTYDSYLLDISSAKPATDDVEGWLRIGTGAGPTYQTTGYNMALEGINTGGGFNANFTAQSSIRMGASSVGQATGNATGENFSAQIQFNDPEDANTLTLFDVLARYTDTNTGIVSIHGSAIRTTVEAITAVRFMFETGNIASGRFSLYGLTKV